MKSAEHTEFCGKDLRKYLYVSGAFAVLIMIGSYWYVEYYKKGLVTAETANVGPISQAGQPANPPAPIAAGNPQAIAAGFARPMTVAKRGTFATVAEMLKESVVNISATKNTVPVPQSAMNNAAMQNQNSFQFVNPFSGQTAMESIGSGSIVTADGYILTNYHVVENADQVFVTTFVGGQQQRYTADVIRLAETTDLALLKIDTQNMFTPVSLGDSERVQVGDQVLAIGSPFGLDQTVSLGIISNRNRSIVIEGVNHQGLLQTDAAINQGNSGGPLVNMRGELIGVNTAIYTPNGAFAGVGFAVSSNVAREFLEGAITLPDARGRKAGFAWPLTAAAPAGAMPPPIPANSPCPHDDRGPCANCHQMLPAGSAMPGQTPVAAANQFAVGPGGAVGLNAAAAAGMAASPQTSQLWIGADVTPLNAVTAQYFKSPYPEGAFVNNVYAGSPAGSAGLMSGDVIFKVDGRWVKSGEDIAGIIGSYKAGSQARVSVMRGGGRVDLYMTISQQPADFKAAFPAQAAPPPAGGAVAQTPPALPGEFEWMGMELLPIDPKAPPENPALKGVRGAIIGELAPNSQAQLAGLLANDVVVGINRRLVDTPENLDAAIKSAPSSGSLVEILRGNQRMYAVLK